MSRCGALLFVQQRLSLSVFRDDGATCEGVLTDEARETDQDGQDEENTHDNEGEDPLECDDVGEELSNTEGYELVSDWGNTNPGMDTYKQREHSG